MLDLRITKCYLVEVIDKDGNVQTFKNYGSDEVADDYYFGTKKDAIEMGRRLIALVEKSQKWVK